MATTSEAAGQAQRQRLLRGLAQSIREVGLARTQVGDIVRHAKASRRTFYKHFSDKDACFVELVRTASARVMADVIASVDANASMSQQIDAGIDAYVRGLRADPAVSLAIYSRGYSEAAADAQREVMERYSVFLAAVVQAATGTPMTSTRSYMLVSGLCLALGRAIERSDDLDAAGEEVKAVLKTVCLAD